MEKIFELVTKAIILCILISALLHLLLYASDSTEYKLWVTLQIALQIAAITTLVFVNKYKYKALIIFALLSVIFTLINAVYINYANNLLHATIIVLFWAIYGVLVYRVRSAFIAKNNIA